MAIGLAGLDKIAICLASLDKTAIGFDNMATGANVGSAWLLII